MKMVSYIAILPRATHRSNPPRSIDAVYAVYAVYSVDSAPADFDPAEHRIIGQHFFGIAPLRPIGEIAAVVVADLRFRRRVQQVHRLGDRVFGELLAELGAERSIMTLIDRKLDTYAAIKPEALAVTGGGDWPAAHRRTRS